MKVLFATDGWLGYECPTETIAARTAREIAAALDAQRQASVVLAAARGEGDARVERDPDDARVLRLLRTDRAPEHWQRSASAAASALVRAALRDERPDVVHVLAWRGLTRELVAIAASERIPAVVTLLDPWFACLVGDRQRRDVAAETACDAPLAASPCIACAEVGHGPTPWVPIEARFMLVAERRRDIERELTLARSVILAPGLDADGVRRALSSPLKEVEMIASLAPEAHAEIYARAAECGPAGVAPRATEWWAERMQVEAERSWDDAFARVLPGARR